MITHSFRRIRSTCILIFMFVMACIALPRFAAANTEPKSLGSLTPGAIVKILENGELRDFIVLKHGYPVSDNGRTLLLRKNVLNTQAWTYAMQIENGPGYSESDIDVWLNSTYHTYLDAYTQSEVVDVAITSRVGASTNAKINRKIFLLADAEILPSDQFPPVNEGTHISYFVTGAAGLALKKAYSDSDPNTAVEWWTRSQRSFHDATYDYFRVAFVTTAGHISQADNMTKMYTGEIVTAPVRNPKGIRPALTLQSNNAVDADGTILEGHVPGAPSNLTVIMGSDVQISWDATIDEDDDVAGYILERSLDGGSTWAVISTLEGTTFAEPVQEEWTAVKYRVKAYDTGSAESGYDTSSSYSLTPAISSIQATGILAHVGGDTLLSVRGVHLSDGIQVSLFLGEDSVVSGTTTGSGTEQNATLTVPANTSETENTIYTVKASLDGGSTWEDTTATITVQRNSPTFISQISASPQTLPADGGAITVSVIGTNLYDNITVSVGSDISGTTTGSETLQIVDLSLPANVSTTESTVYEIRASLDSGTVWSDISGTSTVQHAEPDTTPEPTNTPTPQPTSTITPHPTSTITPQPTSTSKPGSDKPNNTKPHTQKALSIPEEAPDPIIDIPKTGNSISTLPFAGFALGLIMLTTSIYFGKSRKKQK